MTYYVGPGTPGRYCPSGSTAKRRVRGPYERENGLAAALTLLSP
jgi:hypothetical protein